jgi:hypothetical protein
MIIAPNYRVWTRAEIVVEASNGQKTIRVRMPAVMRHSLAVHRSLGNTGFVITCWPVGKWMAWFGNEFRKEEAAVAAADQLLEVDEDWTAFFLDPIPPRLQVPFERVHAAAGAARHFVNRTPGRLRHG